MKPRKLGDAWTVPVVELVRGEPKAQSCAALPTEILVQQAEQQQVLERYHEWLRLLTPAERAEIESYPAHTRIEKITELVLAQEAKLFRKMAGGWMMSRARIVNPVVRCLAITLASRSDAVSAARPGSPLPTHRK